MYTSQECKVAVLTREDAIAAYNARNEEQGIPYRYGDSGIVHPCYADIEVTMYFGGDDPEVTFSLLDTGNETDGRVEYDVDVNISNNDCANPRQMCDALNAATERFYAEGFDIRFGRLTGEFDN